MPPARGRGRGGGRGRSAKAKHPGSPPKKAVAKALVLKAKPSPKQDLVGATLAAAPNPFGDSDALCKCQDKLVLGKVNRLYVTKLKKYDRDELNKLAGRTSKLSIQHYLYNGIAQLPGSAKHLSTKFWAEFFTEYGLGGDKFVGLSELEVDESEEPQKFLMDALLDARVENPAERNTGPFVSWREHDSGDISKTDFILMLNGCLESDRLCASHSETMLAAAHAFIGVHKLQEKYEDVWRCAQDDFDHVITNTFCNTLVADEDRKTWVVAHRHALTTVMPVDNAIELLSKDRAIDSCWGILRVLKTIICVKK